MQTYLKKVCGILNALLLVVALILFSGSGPLRGKDLVFAILVIVTPAFTLFFLLSPPSD